MAGRIRSIKPELREHNGFAGLSDGAARLFLMLYTLADDAGVCPADPGFMAGAVFFRRPKPLPTIGRLLSEIETAGLITRYEVARAPFLKIVGWTEKGTVTHQRIDKPQPSRYPASESIHSENDSAKTATNSQNDSWTDQDLRPWTTDLRRREAASPTNVEPAKPPAEAPPAPNYEADAQRGRLAEIKYAELSRRRIALATELGLPIPLPYPTIVPNRLPVGFQRLRERLREEGDLAAIVVDAILDHLEAEAREGSDLYFFDERSFAEDAWRNARSKISVEPDRDALAAEPRRPAKPAEVFVSKTALAIFGDEDLEELLREAEGKA